MKNLAKMAGRKERGAVTIFITVVMLIFLTVMVVAAFGMSSSNLQAVGNVQFRKEAIAAANYVIETRLSTNFTAAPTPLFDEPVHINNNPDAPTDYLVNLQTPTCVRATQIIVTVASSVSLPGMTFGSGWDTLWELDATATNPATGAQARVVQGVRVQLTNAERVARCPDV
jgi:TRAP-type C4-dicarboxylate transport system permease small subunit